MHIPQQRRAAAGAAADDPSMQSAAVARGEFRGLGGPCLSGRVRFGQDGTLPGPPVQNRELLPAPGQGAYVTDDVTGMADADRADLIQLSTGYTGNGRPRPAGV